MATIIWVEENTSVLFPLVKQLICRGDTITTCNTVREALEKVDQIRKADLLLLGIFLASGWNQVRVNDTYLGCQLLRKLRLEYGVLTPALALLTLSTEAVINELKALDAVSIMQLPCLPSSFVRCVDHVLAT